MFQAAYLALKLFDLSCQVVGPLDRIQIESRTAVLPPLLDPMLPNVLILLLPLCKLNVLFDQVARGLVSVLIDTS
ncbi:hypothetical protein BIY45_03175 [Stenotrophomonas sp. BIIR7]|nr:hypothetical protein BIY45_03175 [Stenotrophomonas sp. BIIR7]PZU05847.1 MAG: hypothetical protein DI605_20915 [Sphingomonas sp.]